MRFEGGYRAVRLGMGTGTGMDAGAVAVGDDGGDGRVTKSHEMPLNNTSYSLTLPPREPLSD